MKKFIGQQVIIRAVNAGVFFGTLESKESTLSGVEVVLSNCRRLWYWDGAASISQIALEGVSKPDNCKFTVVVEKLQIMQVIEIIPCTDKAITSINSVAIWKK